MHIQTPTIRRSNPGTWQRIAAGVIFGVALLVLGYGFGLRPWLSRSVGEQVAAEIRTQLESQITAQLTASLGDPSAAAALPADPPALPEPAGAPPAADAAIPALPQVAEPSAPAPGSLAEQGAQAATALAQSLGQAAPAAANEAPATSSVGAATGNADAPVVVALALTPTSPPPAASATALPPTPEPLATAIPRVVAALPPGEVVLREDTVNRRIAERLVGRGPIENAEMRFVPSEMQVDLRILGTDNQIRAGLAITGGRVVVRDATLSGPMALAIAVGDLIDPIEAQVNESLEVTGRNLLAVRIENGRVVVTIE